MNALWETIVVYTAKDYLVHGGEKVEREDPETGKMYQNKMAFRRMPINVFDKTQKTYRTIDCPMIGGNAAKQRFRENAAYHLFEFLGLEDLLLSAGTYGLLVKGQVKPENAMPLERIMAIQKYVPFVEVMGYLMIGHYSIPSKLITSSILPIVEEIVSETEMPAYGLTLSNIMTEMMATKHDTYRSIKIKNLISQFENMNTEEIATEIAKIQEADKKEDQEENKNSKKEKKETKDQMIYYFEVMSIGTALTHTLRLEHYSDLQLSALGAAMARFKNLFPYIGGKKTMGCGRVKIKYDELPDKSLYEEYLDKHKKEIKDLLMAK